MSTQSTRQFALELREHDSPYSTTPRIEAVPVWWLDGDRYPDGVLTTEQSIQTMHDDEHPLAGLNLQAYLFEGDPDPTYFELRFALREATLDQLRATASAAERMHKALAKLQSAEGPPADFGQFVNQLARALGVKYLVHRRQLDNGTDVTAIPPREARGKAHWLAYELLEKRGLLKLAA